MGSCPSGEEYDAGLCYTDCPPGYDGVLTKCYGICPTGYRDDGLFCRKPDGYGRGAGHETEEACKNSTDPIPATYGCEQSEPFDLWYPICGPGFKNFGCCFCTPVCPDGWSDIGVSCVRPEIDRGGGSIPSVANWEAIKWWLIAIGALIIFLFIFLLIWWTKPTYKNKK